MLRNDLLGKESVNVWKGFCSVLPACLLVPPVFVHCFRYCGGFLGQTPFFTPRSTTHLFLASDFPASSFACLSRRPSSLYIRYWTDIRYQYQISAAVFETESDKLTITKERTSVIFSFGIDFLFNDNKI